MLLRTEESASGQSCPPERGIRRAVATISSFSYARSLLTAPARRRSARSPASALRREVPRVVPAEAAVKELPSSRTQERKDVLEIGSGTRCGANGRRIEQAAPRGEEDYARETAAHLDATRADVLVRQAIAREERLALGRAPRGATHSRHRPRRR